MDSHDRSILTTFTALVAVVGFVLAAVAVTADGGPDVATVEPVAVTLSEFAVEPGGVTVAVGGALSVTNAGVQPHNLTVRDTDLRTPDLGNGGTAPLDLSPLSPGDYEVYCSIPGHAEAGMVGDLTVTAPGTGEAAAAAPHDGHATDADPAAMDQAMLDSIAAFPAQTQGAGNEILEPQVLPDGTKEFELAAAVTPWEVAPGQVVDAWTYNGMVPGPMITVDVGDRVRVVFHNDLPVMSDIHFHGIELPNDQDGVAPITQEPVRPGDSFVYEFTVAEPAVSMYHAHAHAETGVPNGLFAVILAGDMPLPSGRTVGDVTLPATIEPAQEIPMVLNDAGVIGLSLNGKSFPATAPIVAARRDWMLVHYYNEGLQVHPMHLHGFDQLVFAKDGEPLNEPYWADTVLVAPGERYSVLVQTTQPGTWVWHCHILNHVEGEDGMFGMVTAVVVE